MHGNFINAERFTEVVTTTAVGPYACCNGLSTSAAPHCEMQRHVIA